MTVANEEDIDCGCTCNGYKLFHSLHRFARPSMFVATLGAFGVVLGAIHGFFQVHYRVNSINASFSVVEWLMLGSQILQAVIAVPLVYAGGGRHRPVWLAFLGGLVAVSCFLFASFILSEYENNQVVTSYSLHQDPSLCVKYSERVVQDQTRQDWYILSAVYLLHFSIGLAYVGYFAFALTYLDDNINAVNSPGVIGIALGLMSVGPLIGMMLAWLCTSTTLTGSLCAVLGGLMLVASVAVGLFPRSLLDTSGGLVSNNIYYTKSKGFFGSFLRVVTNRIFMLITLALTLAYTAIWNFSLLLARYEESVYYAAETTGFEDSWTTRQIITFMRPVLGGLSIVVAGITIFRSEPSPIKLSIWATAAFFLTAAVFSTNVFLTCPDVHITTESHQRLDLTMYCNKDCQCKEDLAFTPVVSTHSRLVYFSPCHAGCTTNLYESHHKVYRNCSCVPTGSVVSGVSDLSECQVYRVMFQCLTVVIAVLVGSTVIGLLLLSFRVVLSCDKPLMITLQLTLVTLLATIPGRQVFLFVARRSCIVSGTDECRLHEAQPFVSYINLTAILFLLLSVGVFVVASFMVRHVVLYGDIERGNNKTAAHVEMREIRTKNSQGKGKNRRHSFHGEEQKLLELNRPPVVIQRAPSRTPSITAGEEHRLSTYEGQMQKAASYSEELNKLLQAPIPLQTSTSGNTLQVPTAGMTVRHQGMLTTLL